MSRTNVLGKGTLSLIIGGLAVAITLSGCDSPVGSATETTAPRDGVMRVLPDRFALDMPGALLPQADPEAQSVGVRTSTSGNSPLDFTWLEKEYNAAYLLNAFWFLIADEVLSNSKLEADITEGEYEFPYDDDFIARLEDYYNQIPLWDVMRQDSDFENSLWSSYDADDLKGRTFNIVFDYKLHENQTLFQRSLNMEIFGDYDDDDDDDDDDDGSLTNISVFWSTDMKFVATISNEEESLEFFAYDARGQEESFFISLSVEEDDKKFVEVNFRRHPTLGDSNGAFFRFIPDTAGTVVILGTADDNGGSLKTGTQNKQYFDGNRSPTSENSKYSFNQETDFDGLDAVAMLLNSGIGLMPEIRTALDNRLNSND